METKFCEADERAWCPLACLEGSWDEVMTVIGKAHAVVHQRNVARVQSTVTVSTRTDKRETVEGKVDPVEGAA